MSPILKPLVLGLMFISLSSVSLANACKVAVFKTAVPKAAGRPVCYQGLPAQFAGNLETLFSGLQSLGYAPLKYDQCSLGDENIPADYTLISQLGDCSQAGPMMNCSLYVALYNNASGEAVYEKTKSTTGWGSVTLHLSEALESLPTCDSL